MKPPRGTIEPELILPNENRGWLFGGFEIMANSILLSLLAQLGVHDVLRTAALAAPPVNIHWNPVHPLFGPDFFC